MAQRNVSELLAGAVVLAVAVGFLGYAVVHTGRTAASGYTLSANFDRIDGLSPGSDVRIAGVKVGRITEASIDPKTYQAQIKFTVQPDVKLPTDSSAEISSDGLLGNKVLSLVPGGDDKMLPDGGRVQITQSAVSLEQLLGKFIFSVGDLSSNVQKSLKENQAAPAAAPAK
jgi:phospholipid/cholesterol/gamma-HCH transport system substrate-binding protein